MKTTVNSGKKILTLFWTMLLLCTVVVISCSKDDNPTVNNNPYMISGAATGAQVVPAVTDSGVGSISGTYNPVNRLLTYTANWDSLTGAPRSGGFYYGAKGVNGIAIDSTWEFDSTATKGSFSDTLTLTSDQATQLIDGNWYYTYRTAANPSGEITGQISAIR